ncbi:methionyl-tRNA formyltransferase [bacterium]|nr:MAG: methionyl-tRNA formyltransferase [bacterium]
MRLIFFGTSTFALPALEACVRAHDVAGVVTQPDRPAGRGQHTRPTPVKEAALAHGLHVLEPTALKAFSADARTLDPDAFAVASYGRILPAGLLAVPPRGAFNIHPSLLPLYRGATPLQSVLLDGAHETGVTIFLMDAGMDTGEIVVQERTPIAPDEDYGALHDRLAARGAALLLEALAMARDGRPLSHAQVGDAAEAARTLTRPLTKDDQSLRWDEIPRRIVDRVRAFAPLPGARTTIGGNRLKCVRARVVEERGVVTRAPGTVVGAMGGELHVAAAGGGIVALQRVIPQDKGAMSGADFGRTILVRWCNGQDYPRFD